MTLTEKNVKKNCVYLLTNHNNKYIK